MAVIPLFFALAAPLVVSAGSLSIGNTQDITSAASALASNLMSYYNEADNGVLPQPYFWWESGGMWATMIEYMHVTGDGQYNTVISNAIFAQAGATQDFMGPNTLGNDDQLWWSIAAMSAVEYGLPAPTNGSLWLQFAKNVYSAVSSRWDSSTCGGGLPWQISTSSSGYNYKNSISNGLFFQLAARLARYTGDQQYSDRAAQVFDWVQSVNLIDGTSWKVYDGTDSTEGCTSLDHDEWTYNSAVFIYGAAVMLDHTGDEGTWSPRLNGLIGGAQATFFEDAVMQESMCESQGTCNTDQLSFKAYLSRWLAATTALVPSTKGSIAPLLQASAQGALASCNGGPDRTCGTKWPIDQYDGTEGVGQQLAALEVVQGLLAAEVGLPASAAKRKAARTFVA